MFHCRVWCLSIYEKILYAQSVRAVESYECFKSWVPDYSTLTEILQLRAVKKEAESFATSCLNLISKLKNSGVLKSIQKDRVAETQQNRIDREEFEGHTLPDPHKALPGNVRFVICRFVDL